MIWIHIKDCGVFTIKFLADTLSIHESKGEAGSISTDPSLCRINVDFQRENLWKNEQKPKESNHSLGVGGAKEVV
jgi:hypothetical protein